jgi:hypothetical protein
LARSLARLSLLTFKGQIMRFEIMRTNDGFMAYDNDCDEYLDDENGDNLFDKLSDAQQLIDDAILTVLEHQGD